MFEQSLSHKILIDAVVRALLLTVLADFLITGYIVNIPVLGMIIVVISSLVPAFLGWLFAKSEKKNNRILRFAIFSFLLGFLFSLCLMLLSLAFTIRLFPTDYMSNASPMLFMMVIPYVLLCTSLLRIILFSFFMIRNIGRQRDCSLSPRCLKRRNICEK